MNHTKQRSYRKIVKIFEWLFKGFSGHEEAEPLGVAYFLEYCEPNVPIPSQGRGVAQSS